ncbi:hypothetical protein Pla52n_23460 [Stieleria varia]|uniref:Uncharacterized protein n=1 Tax=Stieleria varia TaxID=2528005 RepID=A0A5C6AZ88_9BACT|nr:hypothetical protein Pla52n_23460 [Stieleria varia]
MGLTPHALCCRRIRDWEIKAAGSVGGNDARRGEENVAIRGNYPRHVFFLRTGKSSPPPSSLRKATADMKGPAADASGLTEATDRWRFVLQFEQSSDRMILANSSRYSWSSLGKSSPKVAWSAAPCWNLRLGKTGMSTPVICFTPLATISPLSA